ncbi:hypothetical protein [Saccharothrix variisporea]|uniref:Quinol monooxygenase YgiN n=1 Tax=Saccharothrix variisporea TaxID=543527 RepID=A0A495WZ59_9PSEU|nr:hypothetical protein [Saccharothrix variisporea]RKT66972.1 hypothetical protein DFJ66_0138 [Saccharothrix variisporea]
MSTHVIQYTAKSTEAADENQELVERIFAELNADDPGGMRYATFRLADGVTFVHVVIHETDENPLEHVAAFADFQKGFGDRVGGPPSFSDATLVGSYRFAR